MRVQDVMSTSVKTISPTASAEAACTTMAAQESHHLVVTERGRGAGPSARAVAPGTAPEAPPRDQRAVSTGR